MDFLNELYVRNVPLTIFGWLCLVGTFFCVFKIYTTEIEVLGINSWIKPFKFYLSSLIFVWSMAWYLGHLKPSGLISAYSWVVVAVLVFELIYISWQAGKGELSHFNLSTKFYSSMFGLMGLAITVMTLFTLIIGVMFFQQSWNLPFGYLWGIRLGIILFVIFAFEGGIMGSQLSHTVGAPDGGPGLRLLNWSVSHGDLRVAHFIGMHALQVLPILGYYVFTAQKSIWIISSLYFLLSIGVLIMALQGKPLIKMKDKSEIMAHPTEVP